MVQFPECHEGLPPHIEPFLRRRAAEHELSALLTTDEEQKRHVMLASSCRNLLEIFAPIVERRDGQAL